jgi:TRAP-type mannitol/chloroaromatic compound transport system permease large subunit
MFKGVVPFIILQLICLAIVAAFPGLVLWLPDQLLGFR